jgi:predicted transcriptional regulator
MSNTIARPAPVGVTKRGIPKVNPAELAAYRKARGVTQVTLADALHVRQPWISVNESPTTELQERTAREFLDAIDDIAKRREKLIAEGLAELAAIRASKKAASR